MPIFPFIKHLWYLFQATSFSPSEQQFLTLISRFLSPIHRIPYQDHYFSSQGL